MNMLQESSQIFENAELLPGGVGARGATMQPGRDVAADAADFPVRRRWDGSLDIDHYSRSARAMHRAEIGLVYTACAGLIRRMFRLFRKPFA